MWVNGTISETRGILSILRWFASLQGRTSNIWRFHSSISTLSFSEAKKRPISHKYRKGISHWNWLILTVKVTWLPFLQDAPHRINVWYIYLLLTTLPLKIKHSWIGKYTVPVPLIQWKCISIHAAQLVLDCHWAPMGPVYLPTFISIQFNQQSVRRLYTSIHLVKFWRPHTSCSLQKVAKEGKSPYLTKI